MEKEFILSPSKKKSKIEGFPSLKSCLNDTKGFKKKLLPIVKLDGGVVNEKWEGIPFTFIIQNVDVSRMDFRLEDQKYRLLAPLKLEKIDEFEEYEDMGVKRKHLQTSVDKIEELNYKQVDHYSNDGLLMQSGSYSYSPQKRLVYSYNKVGGALMPVTKIVQYYKGNGEWLDSELHTYHYDADGFIEGITIHQPGGDIKITEKILYKKTRKGFTASKELASHILPAIDKNLGVTYTRIPFSAKFEEEEDAWYLEIEGRSITLKKSVTNADYGDMIYRHAFNHFYDSYSGFLKYTCKIERQDKIQAKVNEKDSLPDTIEYTFSFPEETSDAPLEYTVKSNKKVVMQWKWGGKYTFEHLGNEIQVTSENRYGTGQFVLSGQYTLQQAIMIVHTESYLWCSNFEQERVFDWPRELKFIYNKTENGIERIMQEVEIKDNPTEGTLRTGEPDWLQSDETPHDPDGQEMEFVAQLDHDHMFGSLFLFYSEKHQMVSQVFQCT
ncbi:hypothetical protein [Chryseobacterium vaccae]|uniref:hypothetical protein n=1 Tax=Chryseobacterium vaccae TaxID=2604424 RepID=UPI00129683AA|nr:hypothetical protein [Chryseobacterium vaccae]